MNQVRVNKSAASFDTLSSSKNFEDMLKDKMVAEARQRHAVLSLKIRQRSVLDLIRADIFLAMEINEKNFKVSIRGVGFTSKQLMDNEIGKEFQSFVREQGFDMKINTLSDGGGIESWEVLEFFPNVVIPRH